MVIKFWWVLYGDPWEGEEQLIFSKVLLLEGVVWCWCCGGIGWSSGCKVVVLGLYQFIKWAGTLGAVGPIMLRRCAC
jgi:hypothetical protein